MTREQAAKKYRALRNKSKLSAKDFDYAVLNELSNNFEDLDENPSKKYPPAQWVAVAEWILG